MTIGKDRGLFAVTYFESFDEGDEGFHDIYEFSVLDPADFPDGVTHQFESIDAAVSFAVDTYSALADKFVAAGMIQEEYVKHLDRNKPSM